MEERKPWSYKISKKDYYKLRSISSQMKDVYNIGKEGIKETTVRDLKILLKKYGMIKVKFQKGARLEKDRFELAEELAKKVGAIIIDIRGFTVTLALDDPSYARSIIKGTRTPLGLEK
ncbi:MAG: YhbY family RNA-binding protein [Euryarchaeota archaeon]|nr:YhbY family RNA-binding protein [Euryarchaeota archaeon]